MNDIKRISEALKAIGFSELSLDQGLAIFRVLTHPEYILLSRTREGAPTWVTPNGSEMASRLICQVSNYRITKLEELSKGLVNTKDEG